MKIKEINLKDSIGEGACYGIPHINGNIGSIELHVKAIINKLQSIKEKKEIIYMQDPNHCIDMQKEKFKTQLNAELCGSKFGFKKIYLSKQFYCKYEAKTCYFEID